MRLPNMVFAEARTQRVSNCIFAPKSEEGRKIPKVGECGINDTTYSGNLKGLAGRRTRGASTPAQGFARRLQRGKHQGRGDWKEGPTAVQVIPQQYSSLGCGPGLGPQEQGFQPQSHVEARLGEPATLNVHKFRSRGSPNGWQPTGEVCFS